MTLFWTVVLGFGAGLERTLAGLRRAYQQSTEATLIPSAFYDRFTKSLPVFFRYVVVTDSTQVKLHDLLERRYPARRTNHTRAAAKLHL